MPRNRWICDICGKEHNTEQMASECEKRHVESGDLVIVAEVFFEPGIDEGEVWPDTLMLAYRGSLRGCKYHKLNERAQPLTETQKRNAAFKETQDGDQR